VLQIITDVLDDRAINPFFKEISEILNGKGLFIMVKVKKPLETQFFKTLRSKKFNIIN
jgi:hypothetical protein